MDQNVSSEHKIEPQADAVDPQSEAGDGAKVGGGGETGFDIDGHIAELKDLGRNYAAATDEGSDAERDHLVYPDDIETAFRTIYSCAMSGAIPTIRVYERRRSVAGSHRWHTSLDDAIRQAIKDVRECAREEPGPFVKHAAMCVVTYGDKMKVKHHDSIPDKGQAWRSAEANNILQVHASIAELDEKPLTAYRMLLEKGLRPTMVVASGGVVGEGDSAEPKLHCYFCLSAPAEGADHQRVRAINTRLVRFLGADQTFKWIGHTIRIPGGVHRKGPPRPAQIVDLSGQRYSLEQLEAALDRVAPEPQQGRPHGKRKSASEKAASWQEWRERILTGEGTHDAMYSYACSRAYLGHHADDIVAEIMAMLAERYDGGNKYPETEVARIVADAVSRTEDSETFQNAEEIRRKVGIMRDPAAKAAHKKEVDAAVNKLTPESVAAGPSALDDLLADIGLLLPDDLEVKAYAERICGKIECPWRRELPARIKRAAARARGLLRSQDTPSQGEGARGQGEDPRPLVDVTDVDHDISIEHAWAAVDVYNKDADGKLAPKIFRGPGGLSRITEDLNGNPVITSLESDTLSNEMKHAARWRTAQNSERNGAPYLPVLIDMLAEKEPPVPPLFGVITTPRVAPDGSIITAPGYQASLKMIYRPDAGFKMPDVPEKPTAADVARAKALIWDQLLEGFPFRDGNDPAKHEQDLEGMAPWDRRKLVGEASRANAGAALITPFARPIIAGPTPLFLFNKTQRRTGASKLANAISQVAFGRPMSTQASPADDDEWRKQITTWVGNGLQMVVLDNVNDTLDSGALAGALTSTWWQDRALGTNRLISGPINWLMIATGNNIAASSEIADRSVMVRQVPGVAEPELRSDFRHADLEAWIVEHRAELVWACLTLIKHWLAEGAPKDAGLKFGGFDDWARTLGGILACAGVTGFLDNRRDIKTRGVNTELRQWQTLFAAWHDEFGDRAVRVGDPDRPLEPMNSDMYGRRDGGLLRLMRDHDIEVEGVNLDKIESARSTLGKKLGRWKGATVDVTEHGVHDGVPRSRVVSVEIADADDAHRKSLLWRLVVTGSSPWVPTQG